VIHLERQPPTPDVFDAQWQRRDVPSAWTPDEARLEDVLRDLPPDASVLDVGCGIGGFLPELLRRRTGLQLTGLDFSPWAIEEMRRRAPAITWVEGDASALPFPDGAFTMVVAADVLEVVADPRAVVAEMARVTVAGRNGILKIVSAPPPRAERYGNGVWALEDGDIESMLMDHCYMVGVRWTSTRRFYTGRRK
jgi:SAM-dependent methyltransferase